jgi:hypothetical protein
MRKHYVLGSFSSFEKGLIRGDVDLAKIFVHADLYQDGVLVQGVCHQSYTSLKAPGDIARVGAPPLE